MEEDRDVERDFPVCEEIGGVRRITDVIRNKEIREDNI